MVWNPPKSNSSRKTRLQLPRLTWISAIFIAANLHAGTTTHTQPHYIITLPKELRLGEAQICCVLIRKHYSISFTTSDLRKEKEHGFVIPSKPGESLEAVLYYPGYQFASIYVPSIPRSETRVETSLKKSSSITLKGKCPLPPNHAKTKYSVVIGYEGKVRHLKSPVYLSFSIGRYAVADNGTFSASIPDFYADPLSAEDKVRSLNFGLEGTQYASCSLLPERAENFKIKPAYPGRTRFVESPGQYYNIPAEWTEGPMSPRKINPSR